MIRVLIADDHAMLRHGLAQVLARAPDVELVGEAADGSEAIALARETRPDVILMDIAMPTVDDVEATRRIARAAPDARVVVLTSFSDRKRILAALDAGAVGYLLKDADAGELVRGIRAAARGESPLDPKAGTALLATRTASQTVKLTGRERDVLRLLAEGHANKLIATRLGISEKTVKAHLWGVYQRINATNRVQAAAWARDHGLVDA